MRDNDDLDSVFFGAEPEKPKPKEWKRQSCRDLDMIMGVVSEIAKDEVDIFMSALQPKPTATKERKPKAKRDEKPKRKTTRRKRRTFKKVKPDEAVAQLAKWVKKLMTARKMVQKYRQAVKRYRAQGKI